MEEPLDLSQPPKPQSATPHPKWYQQKIVWILGILSIIAIGGIILVLAQDVRKAEITAQQNGKQTNQFTGTGAAYFLVSEHNEMVRLYPESSGTSNYRLPDATKIYRYDMASGKLNLIKEGLPEDDEWDYDKDLENISRVATSNDGNQLVYAKNALFLMGPNTATFTYIKPQESLGQVILDPTRPTNKATFSTPVFSPDGQKLAYFVVFYDSDNKETKKQVRIISLKDYSEEVVIDGVGEKAENEWYEPFSVFPVRWYKDSEGEKILLERREMFSNAQPVLTAEFKVFDVQTKQIISKTFFIQNNKPIEDCSNKYAIGRGDAKCNTMPFYMNKSPNGRYMMLSWDDRENDFKHYEFILDFSILENNKPLESATIPLESATIPWDGCRSETFLVMNGSEAIWASDEEILCSGFDIENSILKNKSAALALQQTDTFTIPYITYRKHIRTGTKTAVATQNYSYKVPESVRSKVLGKLEKAKKQLEKDIERSKEPVSEQEFNQALDYYSEFSVQFIASQLAPHVKTPVGTADKGAYFAVQSLYIPEEQDFLEKIIGQQLYITNLKGKEQLLQEHTVSDITNPADISKKLQELAPLSKHILEQSYPRNNTLTIQRRVQIHYLGQTK